MAPVAPVAAIQSDKLYVDNDQVRDDLFDVDRSTRNISGNYRRDFEWNSTKNDHSIDLEHVHRVE